MRIRHLFLILSACLIFSCDNSLQRDVTAQKAGGQAHEKVTSARSTIVFLGTSLTAGYGVRPEQAYPALIQERLDSLGLEYEVVNAGVSGETTSSARSRIGWVLEAGPDIFILESGANDGLRGLDPALVKKNLQSIIDTVRRTHPETRIVLVGMQVPPSMGEAYADQFRQVFVDLAAQNDLPFIPFLLEGVGGEPDMNLSDGIHPNVKGHQVLAANVWEVLKELL